METGTILIVFVHMNLWAALEKRMVFQEFGICCRVKLLLMVCLLYTSNIIDKNSVAADITADRRMVIEGGVISFKDTSLGRPTRWKDVYKRQPLKVPFGIRERVT